MLVVVLGERGAASGDKAQSARAARAERSLCCRYSATRAIAQRRKGAAVYHNRQSGAVLFAVMTTTARDGVAQAAALFETAVGVRVARARALGKE